MDASPGTWLADLCAREGMPVVLGHARSRKALPGGQAKHDQLDASKIAVVRRGGMLPQAYVSPAAMRATKALLRRRLSRMRQRAACLPHVQQTNRQDHWPKIGQQIADPANRESVAERCPDPAVQQSIDVDLALLDSDDGRLTTLERDLVQPAKAHEAQTCSRWRSIPGVGKILALVLRDDIQAIHRFPRVQACVSYGRLVTCAHEAAGTRDGPAGQKIGHASLPWACSEAAVLFLRNTPAGQTSRARFEKQHGLGNALTGLAHPLARAVYALVKRDTACDLDKFFQA